MEPRLDNAYKISSSIGGVHRVSFSSSVMTGENKSSISFSM